MSELTQKDRRVAINTPKGEDKLHITGMSGSESLGRMFRYDLELLSHTPFEPKNILGQPVAIRVDCDNADPRYFNGYVSRFGLVKINETKEGKLVYHYRAELVPWLWFLSRTSNCRIFQEMTVPEIVKKIFKDRGFTDIEDTCTGSYSKMDYCVQYRETDLNFISRLLEHEGIYYFWRHEQDKHSIVLCDSSGSHEEASEEFKTLLYTNEAKVSSSNAWIWDWSMGQEITPNRYAMTDYSPEQPLLNLFRTAETAHEHDADTYEVFEYPGGYVKNDVGGKYCKVRMEEIEAGYTIATATTPGPQVFAGATFAMEGHPVNDGTYLVTSVHVHVKSNATGESGTAEAPSYTARLTCIPASVPFRPARVTPKPVVQGPQTAIVVTASGEEITVDKYGRVKVKFHWDRTDEMNDKSSCWVRVSQGNAGKGWGSVSIPRKGQEVIVDFLEGDPDKPIITGRVYNAECMPPYEFPKAGTCSGMKSMTKGGNGFNEIRMEDTKNAEQLFINAQKNMDVQIGNDYFETIKKNKHSTVTTNNTTEIGGDNHETVKGSSHTEVAATVHISIGGAENIDIGGAKSENIGGAFALNVGGAHSISVGSGMLIQAKQINVKATSNITLECGGSQIVIAPDGILIKTQQLLMKSSGMIYSKAAGAFIVKSEFFKQKASVAAFANGASEIKLSGGPVIVKGTSIKLSASGPIQVKGAMIGLN